MSPPLRIANISGFYGDRIEAASEMMAGPDRVDVLTGDYLAELTMLILWKARRRDSSAGYATTFLRQMEDVLGRCLDQGVRVVANAGGINPHGLAQRLREVAEHLGLNARIAVVDGDDVLDKIPDLVNAGERLAHLDTGVPLSDAGVVAVTANAYLGGFGIAAGLRAGADVVVTARVTDAALVVGPAAWWHGWQPLDIDPLAGAVVAGHIIECGPQVTGGNYCFADDEIKSCRLPGYPIAEVEADGTCVITKQPGTGGAVTIGTVTAQLLYEVGEPAYANPDVTALFDTIQLEQEKADRVRVSGVRGRPPSGRLKVAINYVGGWRNTMTLVLTGLQPELKAARAIAQLEEVLGGWQQFAATDIRRVGEELRITVKDADRVKVGRRFSGAVTSLLLASYAGAYTTTPPTDASEYGVYWPTTVAATYAEHAVTLPDGTRTLIPPPNLAKFTEPRTDSPPRPAAWKGGSTRRAPLGLVCGGRSGDKGGNANIGLWANSLDGYRWLSSALSIEGLQAILPEVAGLEVRRYELPNIRALNFVVVGLLGEGVASSVRPDPQAKALAEELRARHVDIPISLLRDAAPGAQTTSGTR